MLLQQIFCIVFFGIVSNKSKVFQKQAGKISFQDFMKLKGYYFSFAAIFILNNMCTFIGTQLIKNAAMFQTLRKLVLVMIYIVDLVNGKKKPSIFTGICVGLVTFGGILTGIDNFSKDYWGIVIGKTIMQCTVCYNVVLHRMFYKCRISYYLHFIYK